eukprot:3679729-Karenia_brevis.AAC.1
MIFLNPFFCIADDVAPAVAEFVSIAYQVFKFNGLTPNFKPGKTEVVILWAGPGAKACKHHVHNVLDSKIGVDVVMPD